MEFLAFEECSHHLFHGLQHVHGVFKNQEEQTCAVVGENCQQIIVCLECQNSWSRDRTYEFSSACFRNSEANNFSTCLQTGQENTVKSKSKPNQNYPAPSVLVKPVSSRSSSASQAMQNSMFHNTFHSVTL